MTTTRRLGEIAADVHEAIGDQVESEGEVGTILKRLVIAQIATIADGEGDALAGARAFYNDIKGYLSDLMKDPDFRRLRGWE